VRVDGAVEGPPVVGHAGAECGDERPVLPRPTRAVGLQRIFHGELADVGLKEDLQGQLTGAPAGGHRERRCEGPARGTVHK